MIGEDLSEEVTFEQRSGCEKKEPVLEGSLPLVVSVSDYLEVKPGRDFLKRKIEFLISRPVVLQPFWAPSVTL